MGAGVYFTLEETVQTDFQSGYTIPPPTNNV